LHIFQTSDGQRQPTLPVRQVLLPISSTSDVPLRIAIVGCGSVVERFHLPASTFVPELSIEFLVDRERRRAATLAASYRVPNVATDFREIIGKVDAAIIALPHNLNAEVSRELLNTGVSVLVEKPMAFNAAEGEHLLTAAKHSKALLNVGYTRRFGYGVQFIRRALRENLLGRITRFSVEDGYPFDWKSAGSEFRLDKTGGGGVLLDLGCHVLDMAIFWFGGLAVHSALHDSLGGVEINAFAHLETPLGIRGTVELSWERLLRNSAIIEGTAGRLEVEWYSNSATAYLSGSMLRGTVAPEGSNQLVQTFDMMFVEQLREWVRVLRGKSEGDVLATGRDAALVLELVEACRSQGRIWQPPWSSTEREKLLE
jgi:UDP-N-acetylglucosamine 3-dehydrogenase